MKTLTLIVLTCGVLAGCAAPQRANYGHPALNAAVQAPVQPIVQNDPGRVAVGTVVGGLIGSQFGGGNGRIAASAVGAATGALLAQGGEPSQQAVGGAIIGGLIGSRFGGGEGRNAATAIGAGLGAWLSVPRD